MKLSRKSLYKPKDILDACEGMTKSNLDWICNKGYAKTIKEAKNQISRNYFRIRDANIILLGWDYYKKGMKPCKCYNKARKDIENLELKNLYEDFNKDYMERLSVVEKYIVRKYPDHIFSISQQANLVIGAALAKVPSKFKKIPFSLFESTNAYLLELSIMEMDSEKSVLVVHDGNEEIIKALDILKVADGVAEIIDINIYD